MKNNKSRSNLQTPIEKHDTAAWANIEKLQPHSNVSIPSESQVIDAKRYVDTNQK